MCRATIDLVSPNGVPVTLEVSHDDDYQTIVDILQRTEKAGPLQQQRPDLCAPETDRPQRRRTCAGADLCRLFVQPHRRRPRATHLDHLRRQAGAAPRETG